MAAGYLAGVLEEIIGEVAVKACEIMEWMKSVARVMLEHDTAISWEAPQGFPVLHEYRRGRGRRVRTAAFSLLVFEDNSKGEFAQKQINAISPNFVHSIDAAHMMLTVRRLRQTGIQHFAMVHDSFGVHASDVDALNEALREEFVRIHREPLLTKFLAAQRKNAPGVDIPDPPGLGQLRIEDVVHSKYFFC
jgi:DNA-directed RNA polymerase